MADKAPNRRGIRTRVSQRKPDLPTIGINDDAFKSILADVAAGEPAYKAAQNHGFDMRTLWYEIANDSQRAQNYTIAKAIGLDRIAEEIQEIADTPLEAIIRKESDKGVEITTKDALGHRQLQIDSRKWLLSKLAPKKYGDKLELSGDDKAPLTVVISAVQSKL